MTCSRLDMGQRLGPGPDSLERYRKACERAMAEVAVAITKETVMLRCKMRVNAVTHQLNERGEIESERVQLGAVYAEKGPNAEWSKWTPCANFDITINNPAAFGKLTKSHEFFVDFSPATE